MLKIMFGHKGRVVTVVDEELQHVIAVENVKINKLKRMRLTEHVDWTGEITNSSKSLVENLTENGHLVDPDEWKKSPKLILKGQNQQCELN
jgi:hypothetical protein